jgi:alpha-N-acetylglucosamine transferase
MPVNRVCLATVTTDGFVPGTLVMVHSFLRHNPWFAGDIVLIHNGLEADNRGYLSGSYERIVFLQAGQELLRRVQVIVDARPDFCTKQARFYALEAFRLSEYDKVLFCDSDVLFRRAIPELFELPEPLVACGDGASFRDRGTAFNSGMFLMNAPLLTGDTYASLLEFVAPEFHGPRTRHMADQTVLNLHFRNQYHLISSSYNFLLVHHAAIYQRERLRIADAHVIHFVGPAKPWNAHDVLHAAKRHPEFAKALAFWTEAYLDFLQSIHLKHLSAPHAK